MTSGRLHQSRLERSQLIQVNDLAGKVGIVTGSSTGIGRQLAVALAQQGMHVVVNGRAMDRLGEVEAEVAASGAQVLAVAAHLADPAEVDRLISETVDKFGGIDLVVNCAGGTFNAPAEEISPKGWHTVIDTNLTSTFLVCRAAFPYLKERAPTSIVNIGSIAGVEPGPGHVHYSVAKAGVHHMTRVLAYEWGPHGIRTNCISPGVIETPRSAFAGNDEKRQAWIRRVPLGRTGRPLDIVGTTLLLASDASAYVNGAVIRIDGGPRSGTAFE
jgi:NAD(P)-dependent dehydrogenase (short-subunit alcohol dehydrogenase family)